MSSHASVRPPAVAGLFYPENAQALQSAVEGYLHAVAPADTAPPKAIIAPHAGYIYSGPVAASAYARLRPLRGTVKRVVLLGPAHRVSFSGLATSSASAFDTPLGPMTLDRATLDRLLALPQVRPFDEAHALEHSLEVQLPFLQVVLGECMLVPLVVGKTEPDAIAQVLERVWGEAETLIVVSSDLSHYHDYETARRRDQATARAIEQLHPEAIGYEDACGRDPINGLLHFARRHGLQARTLDLRNSGDTAGPPDRVVGYGAFAFRVVSSGEGNTDALAPS